MKWEHEGEGWLDRLDYLWCRIVGHRPAQNYPEWFCLRCGDVLPKGNKKRQP